MRTEPAVKKNKSGMNQDVVVEKARRRAEKKSDPSIDEASMDIVPKAHFMGPRADGLPIKRMPGISMGEQLAESNVAYLNYKWKDAEKDFPKEPWLRSVRQYFPFAAGGSLMIDYPRLASEIETCERKKKIFEVRKLAYLVIGPKMNIQEAAECLRGLRHQLSLKENSSTPKIQS